MFKYFFSILFFTFFAQHIAAQSAEKLEKPNLILFMLNVSTNKLEAMKDRGATQEQLNIIMEEDRQTNYSIISDFKNNFSYCPVYYFYSTNYDAVKNKEWNEISFFDAEHLDSPKQIEMNSLGNYYIVEVNYPPAPVYEKIEDPNKPLRLDFYSVTTPSYANARDYSLIMYQDDFTLIKGKMAVTNISLRKVGSIFKPEGRKYRFIGAEDFQHKINKYFKD